MATTVTPCFPTFCLLLSLLLANSGQILAQQTSRALPASTSWFVYQGDARLSPKWSVHTEAQLRRSRVPDVPQQTLALLAGNYHAAPHLLLTAGYGLASTTAAPRLATQGLEYRLYEQVQLQDTEGRVRVQHRYRMEQRWQKPLAEQKVVYVNRVRYQLRATLPLRGTVVKPGSTYATAYDELFFNFGRHALSIFDQNRAALALGYQVSKAAAVEAGYLNQLVPLPGGFSSMNQRHVLQVSFVCNPDLRPPTPPTLE